LEQTLIQFSSYTYLPSERELIEKLQNHFKDWNTEEKKLENLSCLNKAIKNLHAAIQEQVKKGNGNPLRAPLERAIFEEALPNERHLSATEFYEELEQTLIQFSSYTYLPSERELIEKLQNHFKAWNTEEKKLENLSCLNKTIKNLQEKIQQTEGRGLDSIAACDEKIAKEFEQTKKSVLTLHNWSKKLTYFTSVSAPQETKQLQEVFIHYTKLKAPPIIMERLQGFFRALGKNHNVKAILWYCTKAYLELPEKSPHGIKKILDKVKAKLHEPVSDPGTPQSTPSYPTDY
jgi:hypothetical protein